MTERIHNERPAWRVHLMRWTLLLMVCVLAGCAKPEAKNDAPAEKSGPRPRYEYTHVYLRQLFFLQPSTLIFAVKTNGTKFLRDIWVKDVGGNPAEANEIDCRVIKETSAETMVVIAPPRPVMPTDAYLIALVLKDGKPRYFTFEKIRDINDTGIKAALCEWTESKHENRMLATRKPTLGAFVGLIKHVMGEGT